MTIYSGIAHKIASIPSFNCYGYVRAIIGNSIKVGGVTQFTKIGDICNISLNESHRQIKAEVIGFNENDTIMIAYDNVEGIGPGDKVEIISHSFCIYPSEQWLGHVLDANANLVDNDQEVGLGPYPYLVKNAPIKAHKRATLEGVIDLGIRSMNTFTTCCYGQRMGIFAGSGVGKSMLMAQLAKNSNADVNVIGLIGERGREVSEFVEKYLGPEGMKNSVVVVSTSDESPVMRKQAAHVTLTIAEYFRDQGKEVLCILDSVTRFAMALREIGLLRGEPPTTKGYPPSVFSELPKLLERAGPGEKNTKQGNITGIFTVLVEGDDHDELVSDTVRGILDGHIILDRKIAEKGRFPAVNVMRSVSRTMPGCNNEQQQKITAKAKKIITTFEEMEDMIKIGAYNRGTNPEIDKAIELYPQIEEFLAQSHGEFDSIEQSFAKLGQIINK